jgi:hypothetical protein
MSSGFAPSSSMAAPGVTSVSAAIVISNFPSSSTAAVDASSLLVTFGPLVRVEVSPTIATATASFGSALMHNLRRPRIVAQSSVVFLRATFAHTADAAAAVDNLDGALFRGNELVVCAVDSPSRSMRPAR